MAQHHVTLKFEAQHESQDFPLMDMQAPDGPMPSYPKRPYNSQSSAPDDSEIPINLHDDGSKGDGHWTRGKRRRTASSAASRPPPDADPPSPSSKHASSSLHGVFARDSALPDVGQPQLTSVSEQQPEAAVAEPHGSTAQTGPPGLTTFPQPLPSQSPDLGVVPAVPVPVTVPVTLVATIPAPQPWHRFATEPLQPMPILQNQQQQQCAQCPTADPRDASLIPQVDTQSDQEGPRQQQQHQQQQQGEQQQEEDDNVHLGQKGQQQGSEQDRSQGYEHDLAVNRNMERGEEPGSDPPRQQQQHQVEQPPLQQNQFYASGALPAAAAAAGLGFGCVGVAAAATPTAGWAEPVRQLYTILDYVAMQEGFGSGRLTTLRVHWINRPAALAQQGLEVLSVPLDCTVGYLKRLICKSSGGVLWPRTLRPMGQCRQHPMQDIMQDAAAPSAQDACRMTVAPLEASESLRCTCAPLPHTAAAAALLANPAAAAIGASASGDVEASSATTAATAAAASAAGTRARDDSYMGPCFGSAGDSGSGFGGVVTTTDAFPHDRVEPPRPNHQAQNETELQGATCCETEGDADVDRADGGGGGTGGTGGDDACTGEGGDGAATAATAAATAAGGASIIIRSSSADGVKVGLPADEDTMTLPEAGIPPDSNVAMEADVHLLPLHQQLLMALLQTQQAASAAAAAPTGVYPGLHNPLSEPHSAAAANPLPPSFSPTGAFALRSSAEGLSAVGDGDDGDGIGGVRGSRKDRDDGGNGSGLGASKPPKGSCGGPLKERFTLQEMSALVSGIEEFGLKWALIQKSRKELQNKKQGDLKDKWRNWQRNVAVSWMTSRVSIPDQLRDRINALVAAAQRGELATHVTPTLQVLQQRVGMAHQQQQQQQRQQQQQQQQGQQQQQQQQHRSGLSLQASTAIAAVAAAAAAAAAAAGVGRPAADAAATVAAPQGDTAAKMSGVLRLGPAAPLAESLQRPLQSQQQPDHMLPTLAVVTAPGAANGMIGSLASGGGGGGGDSCKQQSSLAAAAPSGIGEEHTLVNLQVHQHQHPQRQHLQREDVEAAEAARAAEQRLQLQAAQAARVAKAAQEAQAHAQAQLAAAAAAVAAAAAAGQVDCSGSGTAAAAAASATDMEKLLTGLHQLATAPHAHGHATHTLGASHASQLALPLSLADLPPEGVQRLLLAAPPLPPGVTSAGLASASLPSAISGTRVGEMLFARTRAPIPPPPPHQAHPQHGCTFKLATTTVASSTAERSTISAPPAAPPDASVGVATQLGGLGLSLGPLSSSLHLGSCAGSTTPEAAAVHMTHGLPPAVMTTHGSVLLGSSLQSHAEQAPLPPLSPPPQPQPQHVEPPPQPQQQHAEAAPGHGLRGAATLAAGPVRSEGTGLSDPEQQQQLAVAVAAVAAAAAGAHPHLLQSLQPPPLMPLQSLLPMHPQQEPAPQAHLSLAPGLP